jgi:NhaP-type Na+/H+ or K+/H+ antiporter
MGFLFGLVLFPVPDKLGRKRTMSIVMTIYLIAQWVSLLCNDFHIKSISYFIQGFLHIKITLSYTHMFELVDEDSKSFCSSVITVFEITTFGIIGFSLQFITRDITEIIKFLNTIQTIGVILYLVTVPESPRWLLMNG